MTSESGAPASETADAAQAEGTTAAPASSASSPPAVQGMDSLFSKLVKEQQSRPDITPKAEQALAALEKAGAKIPKLQQSLGETYDARYCTGGYTLDGNYAVSVCEYADAAAALAGRDLSKKILAKVTARDTWAHKSLTLTLVQLRVDAASNGEKPKLVGAFTSL